jgi:tRNA(Ile2) C34 agmatinyltransferase TiaS
MSEERAPLGAHGINEKGRPGRASTTTHQNVTCGRCGRRTVSGMKVKDPRCSGCRQKAKKEYGRGSGA